MVHLLSLTQIKQLLICFQCVILCSDQKMYKEAFKNKNFKQSIDNSVQLPKLEIQAETPSKKGEKRKVLISSQSISDTRAFLQDVVNVNILT